MKKSFKLLFTVVFICAVVYFAPKLIHKCDDCETWFVGTGYETNIIADVASDTDQTICKSCAEKQHIIETTMGKSLDEFKKGLFD